MDYKYFHLAAIALEACADNFTHPVIIFFQSQNPVFTHGSHNDGNIFPG